MEQLLDINDIIQQSAAYLIIGILGWHSKTVRKNRRDMNCMFRKVRRLYRHQFGDAWEEKWND